MTSISYDNIFNYFLGNVTAYEFANLSVDESDELLSEYLHKTVADSYVRTLFKSLTFNDTDKQIEYELSYSAEDGADKDFILIVLSNGMTIQWLKPKVRSGLNVMQFFGGKEQKFYSQANHIDELRGMLEDATIELRNMIRDRGYINNAYLSDKNDGI